MKYQRGVALSGLIFWAIVLVLVAVVGLKVTPTVIEYIKILKDSKAVVSKMGPDSTVADVRKSFDNFANIDQLAFSGNQLDVSKNNGKIVIEFAYEKRIPLFWNVSLLIEYKGSTAE